MLAKEQLTKREKMLAEFNTELDVIATYNFDFENVLYALAALKRLRYCRDIRQLVSHAIAA